MFFQQIFCILGVLLGPFELLLTASQGLLGCSGVKLSEGAFVLQFGLEAGELLVGDELSGTLLEGAIEGSHGVETVSREEEVESPTVIMVDRRGRGSTIACDPRAPTGIQRHTTEGKCPTGTLTTPVDVDSSTLDSLLSTHGSTDSRAWSSSRRHRQSA